MWAGSLSLQGLSESLAPIKPPPAMETVKGHWSRQALGLSLEPGFAPGVWYCGSCLRPLESAGARVRQGPGFLGASREAGAVTIGMHRIEPNSWFVGAYQELGTKDILWSYWGHWSK